MYKIDKRPSGYILKFAGNIDQNEMQQWYDESQRVLSTENRSTFGVIIDMKDLLPVSADARQTMVAGQQLYKDKGMNRSAVLLVNQEVCNQFKNLAMQSGIYATERYIDASQSSDAIDKAIKWVNDGIDPDQ